MKIHDQAKNCRASSSFAINHHIAGTEGESEPLTTDERSSNGFA